MTDPQAGSPQAPDPAVPDAKVPDPEAVHGAIVAATVRRSGSRLLVVTAEATIALGAAWLLVMVVPYLDAPGQTIALADSGPLRMSSIGPRLVGVVLSAFFASLSLALPRWRAGLFCTAGSALAALTGYSIFWAVGVRSGTNLFSVQIGWYGDLLLAALAVLTLAAGVVGVLRSLAGRSRLVDRRRLPSTPYVAVLTAVIAIVTNFLFGRDPLFPTAYAFGSNTVTADSPLAMKLASLLLAALLVVVPVAAAVATERRVGQGLALGWLAITAVLATRVLTLRVPGYQPDTAFLAGLALVVTASIALLAWLEWSGRTPPFTTRPSAAERRTHMSKGDEGA